MNWAWFFLDPHLETWIQFNCTECLVIEYGYQAFRISKQEEFRHVKFLKGIIDLETLVLTKLGNTGEKLKVMRSKHNIKVRPNGQKRHDPFMENDFSRDSLSFIHHTDLEWMSLNYRK